MKCSIQFFKIKCSQTTRQVKWSDMKDSSIKLKMTECFRTPSATSGSVEIGQAHLHPVHQISGTGTVRSYGGEEHNQPLFLSWLRELRSLVHNMLVQTMLVQLCMLLYKAHLCPPRPPRRRKTGGASSPLSGGRNRSEGIRTQRASAGSDGKGRR